MDGQRLGAIQGAFFMPVVEVTMPAMPAAMMGTSRNGCADVVEENPHPRFQFGKSFFPSYRQ